MAEKVYAPFAPDVVVALNKYQASQLWHPFTCPYREQSGHQFRWGDVGTLVAQQKGMICPDCGFHQGWVHEFMADSQWLSDRDKELRGL